MAKQKVILKKKDVVTLLKEYDLGTVVTFSLFKQGSVHSTYKIVTTKGSYVCRIFQIRTVKEMQCELKLLEYMRTTDVNVPKLQLTKNGKRTTTLLGKKVMIYKFVRGKVIKDFLTKKEHVASLGTVLGQYHQQSYGFYTKELEGKHQYGKKWILECVKQCKKANVDYPYEKIIRKYLSSIKEIKVRKAVIHGDLHGDNALFYADKISGLIDFDDCNYAPQALDIGCVIGWWCVDRFPRHKVNWVKIRAFLKAYQKERPLLETEKKYLLDQVKLFILIHLVYWWWSKEGWTTDIRPYHILEELSKYTREEFREKCKL